MKLSSITDVQDYAKKAKESERIKCGALVPVIIKTLCMKDKVIYGVVLARINWINDRADRQKTTMHICEFIRNM